MKSRNREGLREFWEWFEENSGALTSRDARILEELDKRLLKLDPRLSWELGPGKVAPWQFVVSPNLNLQLRERAREIILAAPNLDDWEFHHARLAKEWNWEFELMKKSGQTVRMNAATWEFVLLEYPGGEHEVILRVGDAKELDEDERWQAAAIVLESILGEDLMMERINDFELVPKFEKQYQNQARSIGELKQALSQN